MTSHAPDCRKSAASRLTAALRRKADQCARLADGAVPPDIADALRLMAEEYEERAVRLERGALPSPRWGEGENGTVDGGCRSGF